MAKPKNAKPESWTTRTIAWLGVVLSVLALLLQWRQQAAGDRRSEADDVTRFLSAFPPTPLESPSYTQLLTFAAVRLDAMDSLLRIAPSSPLALKSRTFEAAASTLGTELANFLPGPGTQEYRLCREKFNAIRDLAARASADLITREGAQRVRRDWDAFVYDEAFRCALVVELDPVQRGQFFAAFFRGEARKGSILATDPWAALGEGAALGQLGRVLGSMPPSHYIPPVVPEDVRLSDIRFSGCDGWLSDAALEVTPGESWSGAFTFMFSPQWSGSPGQDLGCVTWQSSDEASGFQMGFSKDFVTLQFTVPKIGPVRASLPLAEVALKPGKPTRMGFKWDFSTLDPAKFLVLRVGDRGAAAIVPGPARR